MNMNFTAWKLSKYGVFSGPYFSAFELNTERYGVFLHIQFECGKIRTIKNSVFDSFHNVSHDNHGPMIWSTISNQYGMASFWVKILMWPLLSLYHINKLPGNTFSSWVLFPFEYSVIKFRGLYVGFHCF